MFWCAKGVKFHFRWGTKPQDQKQETGTIVTSIQDSKPSEKQISQSFSYCELINLLRNGTIVCCLWENKKTSEKSVNQLSQLSFLWPFSLWFYLFSLAPSVLLGISSSSEIQKELLLVFKSFYAPQVKEDNPMAWNVSSKLLWALSLGKVCLYLFK